MKNSLLTPALASLLVGCAGLPFHEDTGRLTNHDAAPHRGPESCRQAFADPIVEPIARLFADAGPSLDPERIELFVWNMQKGSKPSSYQDLQRLAAGKDLVLIQEARLEQRPVEALDRARFWSFAPGFRTDKASTGVMTLSAAAPLTHCYLSDREPWLRSPKAIGITRYGLESSDKTLAVVNVHAVNFTIGVADYRRQLEKVGAALEKHDGPVILAGDFNTWRDERLEILQQFARTLELDELSFDLDNRVTPFGAIVDRVFVRGLSAIESSTEIVDSSDHNPMSVVLKL